MGNSKWFATDEHSVTNEMEALATLAGFGLAVYPERCVRVRNRHSSCRRCADACTSGCITLEDGMWKMDHEKCVGCGTCATVCPTCALEAQHPGDYELLSQARASMRACGGAAVFCCHRVLEDPGSHVDPQKVARVICLSRLEETMLATLAAEGATEVVAVRGDCEGCPRAQGRESVRLVGETFAEISRVWGIKMSLEVVDEPPRACLADDGEVPGGADGAGDSHAAPDLSAYLSVGEEHLDARAQGSLVVQQGGSIEASYRPVHVMADGTLPHFVPTRRRRLLDQLARFGEPEDTVLDTRLWGHVVIDFDLCQSCKMCAVFCPTGAICKYSEDGEAVGIEHYVAECVHCCLCQDICPAGAISCVTQVPARQLAAFETERYHMPDPEWYTGPDQILRRLRPQIDSQAVDHSY